MRLGSWLNRRSARQVRPRRESLRHRRSMSAIERLEDRLQLTPTTYTATGLPLPVPPIVSGSASTSVSTIHVADEFVIQDVNVRLNIQHTWDADLDVFLIAPDGTRVELFAAIGGSFDNFTATTLDQQADQFIVNAFAPFTGTFRPSGDLSALNGHSAQGDWQLELTDTFLAADNGTLTTWSLELLTDVENAAPLTYSATDLPLRVPPVRPSTTVSMISVADEFVVQDVNLQLTIEHTYDSDLRAVLVAPNGTRVTLFSGVGGSGGNFIETNLDQQASQAIASGTAPFTGTFRPSGDLSTLNGLNSQGIWQLEITDTFLSADSGRLLSWSLTLDDVLPDIVGGTLGTSATTNSRLASGTINTPSDVDLYSINLPAGLSVTASLTVPPGSQLEGYLRVFDAAGVPLESTGGDTNGGATRITFTPQTIGRYYIGVSSLGNETYDPVTGAAISGSTSGAFEFRVTTDATQDFTEFPATNWQTFAEGGTASVSDDQTHVIAGNQSLKFVTTSGFDTGVILTTGGSAWDLSDSDTLEFSTFAENPHPLGFQGNQPNIDLVTTSGVIHLRPNRLLIRNQQWQQIKVPLAGDSVWSLTTEGAPDLSAVTSLVIHLDTWDFGFTVYFDDVKFSARPDVVAGTASGTIETPSDVELLSIDLPAGLRVTASLELTSGSDLDGCLRVFDLAGHPLDVSESVTAAGQPQVTFSPPTQGRYLVGVSSLGNENYDPVTGTTVAGSTTGGFLLRVTTDAAQDVTESAASNWQTFASDGRPAFVSDDQSHVLAGNQSLKFFTRSGFDTGIELSTGGSVWNLSDYDTLELSAFADNPNPFGFQGNQPIVELFTPSGSLRLRPNQLFPRNHEWQRLQIPLAGDDDWVRTLTGTPDLSAVTGLSIQLDTWDTSFTMYFDGIRFLKSDEPALDHAASQMIPLPAPLDSAGAVELSDTGIAGEYVLNVAGTGTLTLSLLDSEDRQFLGTVSLLATDRRVLREQNFVDSSADEPSRVVEHIGPGNYLVVVRPRDIASLQELSVEANFVTTSDPRLPTSVGAFPKSALTVNLNDDEFLDVVTVNEFSNDVSVLLSRGDGTFELERRFSVGLEPVTAQAVNVGGDHHLDLVTVNEASNDVSVLLWRDGTFLPERRFAVGVGPVALRALDIDGDLTHQVDLVVANRFSNDVSVLINLGNGMFGEEQRLTVGDSPNSVQVLDANGDQQLDIVTANELSKDISVLLGTGGGLFESQRTFPVSGNPTNVQAVDVNGDHRLDLIAPNHVRLFGDSLNAYEFNPLSLLLGTDNGSVFQSERSLFGVFGPTAVEGVTLNSDQTLDLVVSNGLFRSVTVLSGFDADLFYTGFFPVGTFPTDLGVMDLDGDQLLDFVTSNEFSNDVSMGRGLGDGSFEEEQRFQVGPSPQAVQIIDMNGDDRLDLVTPNLGRYDYATGSYSAGSVSVLRGNGDGTFAVRRRFSIGDSGIGYIPLSMNAADVNDDGRVDLIAPNGFGNDVSVLLGRGDGTFEPHKRFDVGAYPARVQTDDLNGDGRQDLITQNFASGDNSILIGRGNGTFEFFQRQAPLVELPDPVFSTDVNGDGVLDLIVDVNGDGLTDRIIPDFLAGEVEVQLADSAGAYSNALSVAPISIGTRPVIENINGDRDANGQQIDDVLVLSRDGDVLYRQGMRVVSARRVSAEETSLSEFQTAIVVNAGQPARDFTVLRTSEGIQIATLDRTGNSVSLFEFRVPSQPGRPPSFERVDTVPINGSLPGRIVSGDFDHDPAGREDFAVINQGTQTISVFLAAANGFQPAGSLNAGAGPISLTTADLNRDGWLDLIVPNLGSGDISVLRNVGNGQFEPSLIRAGAGPYFIGPSLTDASRLESQSFDETSSAEAGDFNGDGFLDVIATNPGSNSWSIVFGTDQGLSSDPHVTLLQNSPARFAVVRVEDIDQDHDDDSVFLNEAGTQLTVYLNSSDANERQPLSFTPTIDLPTPLTGFTLRDANGDHLPDVFATNEFGDLLVLLNRGEGRFTEDRHADRRTSLAVLDFDLNNDGQFDAVVTNLESDQVSIRAAGNGASLGDLASNAGNVTAPGAPQLTDLNNDGVDDLIVPNTGGNSVMIYRGIGNGTFGLGEEIFTGSNPSSVTVSDLDGDPFRDLVVTNRGSNSVAVFYGQPFADFQTVPGVTSIPFRAGALSKLPSGSGPVDAQVVTLRDPVDGTMQTGLVVTNGTNDSVSFIPSAGNGIFDARPSNTVMLNFSPLPGAIVNNMLVLPNPDGSNLGFLSLSAGNFRDVPPVISYSVGLQSQPVGIDASAHLNDDAFLDLVVLLAADNGASSVSLLLGDGNGFDFSGSFFLDGITQASDLQVAGMNLYVTEEGRDFFTVFDLADLQREHGDVILDFAEISGGFGNSVAGTNRPIFGVGPFSPLLLALFGALPSDDQQERGATNLDDQPASWQTLVSMVTQVMQKLDGFTNDLGNSLLVSALTTISTDLGLLKLSQSDTLRTSVQAVVTSLSLLPGTQPVTQVLRGLRSLRLTRPNAPASRPSGSATPPAVKPPVTVPIKAALDQSSAVSTNDQAELANYLGQLVTDNKLASELFDHGSRSSESVFLKTADEELSYVVPGWPMFAGNGLVASAVAKFSPRPLRQRHSPHRNARRIERDIAD